MLIIDRGRIVGEGSPEELRTRLHGHAVLRVELEGAPPEAAAAFEALPEVAAVRSHPLHSGSLLVQGVSGADPRAPIFHAAVARGWVLLALEQERASLEDVFIRLTTHEDGSGRPAPTEEGWEDGPAQAEPATPEEEPS